MAGFLPFQLFASHDPSAGLIANPPYAPGFTFPADLQAQADPAALMAAQQGSVPLESTPEGARAAFEFQQELGRRKIQQAIEALLATRLMHGPHPSDWQSSAAFADSLKPYIEQYGAMQTLGQNAQQFPLQMEAAKTKIDVAKREQPLDQREKEARIKFLEAQAERYKNMGGIDVTDWRAVTKEINRLEVLKTSLERRNADQNMLDDIDRKVKALKAALAELQNVGEGGGSQGSQEAAPVNQPVAPGGRKIAWD